MKLPTQFASRHHVLTLSPFLTPPTSSVFARAKRPQLVGAALNPPIMRQTLLKTRGRVMVTQPLSVWHTWPHRMESRGLCPAALRLVHTGRLITSEMPLDRSKGVCVSQLRKHPHIFESTYWGDHNALKNPRITDQVIGNRNSFVLQYKITKKCINRTLEDIHIELQRFAQFDHLDFYSSAMSPDCVVMVNSPYFPYSHGDVEKKQLVDELVSLGFIPAPPLYLQTPTVSAIMIFSCKNLAGLRDISTNWKDKPKQLL